MSIKQCSKAALFALSLFALLAAALLFVQPVGAAESEEGYHVGTSIDLSDASQVYTDATYTSTGIWDDGAKYWRVEPGKQSVFEAVFPADAESAWIGMSIVGHVTNAKIEVSSNPADESSWVTKLASVENEGTIAFPENPDCIVIKARGDNTRHCYIDVTDLLTAGQPSPIYLRLSEGFVSRGNETGIFELKFFEGNVFTQADTLLGAYDLFSSSAVNEANWFAHGNSLMNGTPVSVAGNGVFIESYSYGLWTVNVPQNATQFSFNFSYLNPNTGNWEITAFANGTSVYSGSVPQDNGVVSLTEAYADFFGTEFRATVMVRDVDKDGNGPYPKYIQLAVGMPAATDENLMPEPEAGTNVVTKTEACKFDVLNATSGLEAQADDPIVADNANVAAFKGNFSESKPFFDGNALKGANYFRSYGIFKLPYEKNSGGYIKINVSGTYLLSVCADEAQALVKRSIQASGDSVYDAYDAYTAVASSLTRVEGQDLYIDVSDYLKPDGGTLYLLITDPNIVDGNGPLLQSDIVLYTYGVDTTPFTASYTGGKVYLGSSSEDVVIGMSSLAAGETVTVVRIGDTQLKSADWSFADGSVKISRSAFETAGAGSHTVTLISGKNDARVSSVTIEVEQDSVTEIRVTAAPTKTSYAPGETLNFAGGTLEVVYASGAKQTVAMTESGVSFSSDTAQSEAGTQEITVTYADKTATFDLTVTAQTGGQTGGETGGCSGSVFGGAITASAALIVAAAIIVFRRKKADQ